jgi:hypothetical protein
MTVTTRIQPIDEDIRLMISDMLSPSAQSQAFADFAEDALADAEATDAAALGYTPRHTTFVDGAESNNLASVSPNGTIAFVFDLLDDLFSWIWDQLQTHAPVKSGRFRDSIKFYVDGTEFDLENGSDVPPASQYVFLATAAYARKIEAGESSQAPDGVFQTLATLAQGRFGNQAKISFAYISPTSGGIVDWAQTSSAKTQAQRIRGGNKLLHTDWLTSVPAIVISVK